MENETIEMEPEILDDDEPGGELIEAEPEKKVVLYAFDSAAESKKKLLANIAVLKKKYAVVPADLTVKKNYQLVADAHGLFKKTLTQIEKTRKEKTAKALEEQRFYNSSAKEVVALIEEIKEPFTKAKTDFDTAIEVAKREAKLAEEKRIDGIVERIAGIKALVEANISSSSEVIEKHLLELQYTNDEMVREWAMEFFDKAKTTILETISKLEELRTMKLQQEQAAKLAAEAEAKRLADEEAARVERERLAEETRLKLAAEQERLAEERRKFEEEQAKLAAERAAEQARINEERRIEAERLAAEQKARDDKARLEKEEAERIQREKDEETARAMAKMLAEIEALKKPVEVVVEEAVKAVTEAEVAEEVAPRFTNEQIRQIDDACMAIDTANVLRDAISSLSPADQRRAAGRAMLEYIGNFTVTKSLLEAIINGEIPYIIYTGEKS